jgi:hypothetical protein
VNQAEPDEGAILAHLELLAAPAVGSALGDGLIEIAYGQGKPGSARLFPLSELHLAAEFAARMNRVGRQTWVGAALRAPGSPTRERAGKKDFYGSFWAWMDDADDWQAAEAASRDCPPDVVVCTGEQPAWRGQYFWRFLEPVTETDRLEELNRAIQHHLGGDDVANADRLVRLAGSVNWPTKPGRTVPELVTLRWANGAASATDFAHARQVYVDLQPKPSGGPGASAGARTIFGQIDLEKALLEAAQPGHWHSVVRDTIAHLVGRKTPDDLIHGICARFTQPGYTEAQTRADVDRLLAGARQKWGAETFDGSGAPAAEPLPLLRELPPAAPFPVDALGTLLGNAARGIVDMIQVPDAMAAQSVLGAAALAVQAHADIMLPIDQTRPTSLYLTTLGFTGDRKDSCDLEALWPIRQREIDLERLYDLQMPAWKRRHDQWKVDYDKILKSKATPQQKQADLTGLGEEPIRPLEPDILCEEPTIEGVMRLLVEGQPSIGLFSTEGGQFIGGYSMGADRRLHTAASLSRLWDGKAVKRIRGGAETARLRGRRLSVHLMIQPDVAALLLADQMLAAQGLLSRLLVSGPDSLVGTRFAKHPAPESDRAVKSYGAQLLLLLEDPPNMAPGKINILEPRALLLSPAARTDWFQFADDIERRMAAGGEFEPIRGLANKLPEHAARIAAVLALVEQPKIGEVGEAYLEAGIALARYFASEALRMHAAGLNDPDLLLAQRLLAWLREQSQPVMLRKIYTSGPNPLRNRKDASKIVQILEDHGWLQRDQRLAEAWSVIEK